MNDDIWKQWQGFLGLFAAPGGGMPSGVASPEAHAFAPHLESAERFTAAARRYFEQAAGSAGPAATQAASALGDFLRAQSGEMFHPFAASPAPPMPEWPALGLTREHQQRSQRAAEAARRAAEAQRRLQMLWSDALREAAGAFAARQTPPSSGTVDAAYLRALYDAWVDCAEEAYARTAHSSAYCDALAELVNASSLWRAEVRASVEHFAKSLDLPTRSEVNTLARRLKSIEDQWAARGKHESAPAAKKPAAAKKPPAAKKPAATRAARPRRATRPSRS